MSGAVGSGVGLGGQGGCERRIEVFGKIHKKWGVGRWGQVGGRVGGGFGSGGRVGGVRVDVKFLGGWVGWLGRGVGGSG